MTARRTILFLLLATCLVARSESPKATALDPLLEIPDAFGMSQDGFEKHFGDGFNKSPLRKYSWLTKGRDRAVFMRSPRAGTNIDLTLFEGEIPCEEVIVDFLDGKINGVNFSIYNRADGGEITPEEFDRRFKTCGEMMAELIGARPQSRKANSKQGLLTEGWLWNSKKGMAVLERNPEAVDNDFEFLRLRVAPAGAKGAIANSMRSRNGASVKKSDLPDHVAEKDGDVWIDHIPMVDQGPKGYCVVSSIQRLFEHYGIPCDQHQLAQVMGSDADTGTSSTTVMKSLGKIDYRFKTRFKVLGINYTDGKMYGVRVRSNGKFDRASEFDEKDFKSAVIRHVDDGIPLLWSLRLGRYPEEPAISPQAQGGHMRLIIGYNEDEKKLIFTDSWGAGHEMKKMRLEHAYCATTGLYTVTPTVN